MTNAEEIGDWFVCPGSKVLGLYCPICVGVAEEGT